MSEAGALSMQRPIVSVLTPVYNGEPYLAECIESVLAQSYTAFEYEIVNNCSTDKSLEIAQAYAKKDRRIRVRTNASFGSAIDNHNIAFSLVPTHSKYCKVVSADDWITPDCVSRMVELAESQPRVGIVAAYQQSGNMVKWQGLSPTVSVISGRDASRMALLEGIQVFGPPTSVLYRSDLIRRFQPFFPHPRSYADTSACYQAFEHCDLGFIHDILSAERVHAGQWSAQMDAVHSGAVAYLDVVLQYGPQYLTPAELDTRKKQVFDRYYRTLGGCVWKLKGRKFWDFHRSRLGELGFRLDRSRLAKAALAEAMVEATDPMVAIRKVLEVVRGRDLPGTVDAPLRLR